MEQMKSEVRDGMQVEWNVPITMDDGVVLRADVFRPLGGGQHLKKGHAQIVRSAFAPAWRGLRSSTSETLQRRPTLRWRKNQVLTMHVAQGTHGCPRC
jgi:predicted acyl esterase